jgi:arginine utilization protein RocB
MMRNIQKENRLRERTIDLVAVSSVVNSEGERIMADKIKAILSDFDIFKKFPGHLRICPVNDDGMQRYSILALVKKPGVSKTVLGIGHFDTVAIEDYGSLKPYALAPQELAVWLKNSSQDPEVLQDLENSDFLFGRGSLDMKSGIAIWLELLSEFNQQHTGKNLLVCFVCDEEGNSKGMIDAIPFIRQMIDDHQLDVISAIDTDYTSPQFSGDTRRFLYGGTIGKILVQFLCVGKEAHAGDPFAGIDANELVSALIEEINMNTAYCDKNDLDVTVPPITLSIKDDKQQYSVQTAKMASVTFNVATIGKDIREWEKMLLEAADKAQKRVLDKIDKSYQDYCSLKGIQCSPLLNQVKIKSYHNDLNLDLNLGDNEDEREFSLRYVKQQALNDPGAQIILFLSMPYYPHHTLDKNIAKHQEFVDEIQQCAPGYTYLPYYPYISDLSFVSRANPKDIDAIRQLIPGYDKLNRVDWTSLDSLNVPMMNMGPWGKDAHKFTERVYVPSILDVYEICRAYLAK